MGKKVSISAVVCFLIAAGFLAADVAAIISLKDFLSNSETVQGTVTDYRQVSRGTRGGPSYRYTIRYTISNGTTYEAFTESGSHERGDRITVTYDTRNPGEMTASTMEAWIFVILFSAGSLIFPLIGYGRLRAARS